MWWHKFGPLFAPGVLRQRVSRMKGFRHRRWHLGEVYVKLPGTLRGRIVTVGLRRIEALESQTR